MHEQPTPKAPQAKASNVILLFSRTPTPAFPARAKRELLTHGHYMAARVLARLVGGGYGGTFRGSYWPTVEAAERVRLRERLLDLARRLGIDPEPIIRPPRFERFNPQAEWPVWPHKLFVNCVKMLGRLRHEGWPNELAEQAARDLCAAAERHEAESRSYKPAPELDRRTAATREPDRLASLRRLLASLKEHGDITDSSVIFRLEKEIYDLERALPEDEWPEYIGGES